MKMIVVRMMEGMTYDDKDGKVGEVDFEDGGKNDEVVKMMMM